MANTSSAKKAQRAALRRRVYNARRKKTVKDALRDISKLIQAKSTDKALALLPVFQKAVDKAVKSAVLKKNTAARMKSRIAKQLRTLAK